MSAVVQSIGSLFSNSQFSASSEPDNASQRYGKPGPDFVLCRDKNGNATAVYGEAVWDFNPYRLSAKKINRIIFDTAFDENAQAQQALIGEAKYLLYCLIYFAGGGRLGTLSVATLIQYWAVLRLAMQFCQEQKQKHLVGTLSLKQLFSVPVYLAAFIREKTFDKPVFSGILRGLAKVGEKRLGYAVVNPNNFDLKRAGCNQHSVIPTRIYLNLINLTGDLLKQLYQGVGRFESFISSFADEHYGTAHSAQRNRSLGGKAHWRPDMPQALKDHCLTSVFAGEFACPYKGGLQKAFLQMQFVAKTVIHLYTGMRDQEVLRMSYHCLSDQIVSPPVLDDQGIERDKPQTVTVLSTTMKFTGYKKEGGWFASAEVVKASKWPRQFAVDLRSSTISS